MTPTPARTYSPDGGHWYFPDGKPAYEVPYADPSKGMRKTTLMDARKLNLLPSVTTILRCLHKQALVDWLIEQACLAVLTTPRGPTEELDSFVHRVLHTEKIQDQEADIAKDRGNEMHGGLETAMQGGAVSPDLWPWIEPAFKEINSRGKVIGTETIVVGPGYVGKVDLVQQGNEIWIWDWKTSKKLPTKGAWLEHILQASAYAKAWSMSAGGDLRIRTGNVYISTVEQGKFTVCEHGDWQQTFEDGFAPLLKTWQWLNDYRPVTP